MRLLFTRYRRQSQLSAGDERAFSISIARQRQSPHISNLAPSPPTALTAPVVTMACGRDVLRLKIKHTGLVVPNALGLWHAIFRLPPYQRWNL